jgi:hypothetical protein
VIYEGEYLGKNVAIKKMMIYDKKIIEREMNIFL